MRSSRRIVLAMDAAGLGCSVAVGLGETILAERQSGAMHGQAETLLPLVDECLREAGGAPDAIGLIAVTVGPGSFTGIRVGLAAARGVALATGAKLTGVTSFEAVAASATARQDNPDCAALLVALESRRQDLYIQFFDIGGNSLSKPTSADPSALGQAAQAAARGAPVLIAGDAAARAAAGLGQYPHAILHFSAPSAAGALRAGLRRLRAGEAPGPIRPLYLRPPAAARPDGARMQSSGGR